MENASKALIIAGGILIAILIISLLVMFYGNIKNLMTANYNTDITEQVAEFNKQYDVYYRDNLYGSDILSLANKVNDYNKRQVAEEGYKQLNMSVTFKSNINIKTDGINITNIIARDSIWTSTQIQNLIEDKTEGWNSIIADIEKNQEIKGYKIQYLSGRRSMELEELFKTEIASNKKYIEENVRPKIDRYLSYKSALATLKSKPFKVEKFEYDDSTGRIILMKFVENK